MAMLLEYDDVDSWEGHLTQIASCIKPYHFPPVPPEIVRKGKEDVVLRFRLKHRGCHKIESLPWRAFNDYFRAISKNSSKHMSCFLEVPWCVLTWSPVAQASNLVNQRTRGGIQTTYRDNIKRRLAKMKRPLSLRRIMRVRCCGQQKKHDCHNSKEKKNCGCRSSGWFSSKLCLWGSIYFRR